MYVQIWEQNLCILLANIAWRLENQMKNINCGFLLLDQFLMSEGHCLSPSCCTLFVVEGIDQWLLLKEGWFKAITILVNDPLFLPSSVSRVVL